MADPFAPPTPQELALFAPPTPEELGQPARPNRAMLDAQSMNERQNKAHQDAMDAAMGEANMRGALLETAARSIPGLIPAAARGAAGITGSVARDFGANVDPEQWRNAAEAVGSKLVGGLDKPSQFTQEQLAPLTGGVSDFLEAHPALHAGATAVSDVLGVLPAAGAARALAPGVGRMASGLPFSPPGDPALLPAYTRLPAADIANRGYTVVPEDLRAGARIEEGSQVTGGVATKLGPDVAGTRIPLRNAGNATLRGSEDIPGIRLTEVGAVEPASVTDALNTQAAPYEQIARDLPTPGANTLAPKLQAAWEARGASLKGDPVAESRLAPLMNPEAPPLSSADLLQRWKEVNGYVADLRNAVGQGSPGAAIKSSDLRAVSNALLDEIDSRAQAFGRPDVIPALQEARTNIARIHALDDSLDNNGFIQGDKLAAAAEQGVPLSGGLAEVAKDAKLAPESFKGVGAAVDAEGNATYHSGTRPRHFVSNMAARLFGDKMAENRIALLNDELRSGSSAIDYPAPQPRGPAPALLAPMGPNAGPPAPPLIPPYNGPDFGVLDEPPRGLDIQPQGLSQLSSPALPEGLSLQRPDISSMLAPRGALTDAELLQLQLEPGDLASISRELNQSPLLSESQPVAPLNGIPVPPRGINEAQLSSPQTPKGFALLPDTGPLPPLGPRFGPGDEFPGGAAPAAPVSPRGPAPSGGTIADFLTNNASGQTAVSREALNALAQQRPRFVVDIETGRRTPLTGIEARDPRAYAGQIIVEENPNSATGFDVVDRGKVPQNHLAGVLARMRASRLFPAE